MVCQQGHESFKASTSRGCPRTCLCYGAGRCLDALQLHSVQNANLYSLLLVADRVCRYCPYLQNTYFYSSCLQTISEDALNSCKALLQQDEPLTPQTTVGFAKTSSPSFIMIAMYATNVCNKHKMFLSSPYNPRCMQIFARYKALLADHSRMLRTRGIEIVHPY